MPLVIILYKDLYLREVLFYRGLEHTKPKGLEPDISIIKILYRRLDEQQSHVIVNAFSFYC
ncbi:hypothetical protein PITCH_A2030235 [uncultured Desulfobacterium sp.]|uniref:Uncharacterized protein n=1 Tax=uncultured Desulfobacterium sp. TaxID=201089 RepID=A0A445MXL0_9BACT|nr:hypothetical protein PITCH_A2030235 [uncultured Desulfobacterium sp.]